MKKDAFIVFDKAYNDYLQYLRWTQDDIYFVTRNKNNAAYKSTEEFELSTTASDTVLKDERICVQKDHKTVHSRPVVYWDSKNTKCVSSYQITSCQVLIKSPRSISISGRFRPYSKGSNKTFRSNTFLVTTKIPLKSRFGVASSYSFSCWYYREKSKGNEPVPIGCPW